MKTRIDSPKKILQHRQPCFYVLKPITQNRAKPHRKWSTQLSTASSSLKPINSPSKMIWVAHEGARLTPDYTHQTWYVRSIGENWKNKIDVGQTTKKSTQVQFFYFFFFFCRCFRDEQRLSCQRRLSTECHLWATDWVGWTMRVPLWLLHEVEWEAADLHSDCRLRRAVLSRSAVHFPAGPSLRVSKRPMRLQRRIALCGEWECVFQEFK